MRHVHGVDVYDDQEDRWYRCDSETEAIQFASQGDIRYEPRVQVATATRFDTVMQYLRHDTEPIMLLGEDNSRVRTIISIAAASTSPAGVAIVGSRASVFSGYGFNTTGSFKTESTQAIWCGWSGQFPPGADDVVVVSAWVESQVS